MKQPSLKVNAVLNGIKQCLGILFPLVTFPYVSRILGEDGFGKYSFSWSIVSYAIVFANLGINTYAIREGSRIKDDKAQLSLFCSEAYTICFITSFLALLSLMTLTISNSKISKYSILILIQSMAIILNLMGRDWINTIFEDFYYLTIRAIVIELLSLFLVFLFVRTPQDVWKFCCISIFASFGGNLFNIVYLNKRIKTKLYISAGLKKHVKPLLVLFATQLTIYVYVNADITMLGFYADDATVGIYSLASKVYNLIKTVVNAMILASLPRLSNIIENMPQTYHNYLKRISSFLTAIIIPTVIGVIMLSESIIVLVGGENYLSGNIPLKILALAMGLAVFCTYYMNSILIVNKKENECLNATLISALVNILLNFLAIPIFGMIGAAVTTIVAEATNLAILIKHSKNVVSESIFDIKNFFQSLMSGVAVVVICFAIKSLNMDRIITVLISFITSLSLYFGIMICAKNAVANEILDNLKRFIKRKFN